LGREPEERPEGRGCGEGERHRPGYSGGFRGRAVPAVAEEDRRPDGLRLESLIRKTGPMTEPIDLPAALARFDEPWSPRTVAVLDDYDIRVVKTKGEFTRHRHPKTDVVPSCSTAR